MSAKKAIRGLAMGIVLAGAAALAIKMKEDKNKKKAQAVADHTKQVAEKVMAHAMRLGKLTKASYHQIIDTAMAEYKDTKQISAKDILELKADLQEGWEGIRAILMSAEAPVKKAAAKKPVKKAVKK